MARSESTEPRNLDGSLKRGSFDVKATSFWRNYLLPRAMFLTVGLPKHSFASVDVTNRCNLRCRHCYFFGDEQPPELSADDFKALMKRLSKGTSPVRAMTWVGGEPLLRKEIIQDCRRHFAHNLVVTNGLIELPNWPDVYFHVSVDGDEAAHEAQRNQKGIYRRIMANADRPDLDVSAAYCISSLNSHCIERAMDDWRNVGIKGFLFSFYTPFGSQDDPLFPGWDERDRIVEKLIDLKAGPGGDFILNEPRVLELMKSGNSRRVTDRCLFLSKGLALDCTGAPKAKCMMGEGADCDRCGCIVPFHLHWRSERKKILSELATDLGVYVRRKIHRISRSESRPNV